MKNPNEEHMPWYVADFNCTKKMQQKLETVMAFHQFHTCGALWLQWVFCEIYWVETGLCTDYIYDQSCYVMLYHIENATLVIVTTNKVFRKNNKYGTIDYCIVDFEESLALNAYMLENAL